MTFLKFQEKPKSSGIFYVYEYKSFRERGKRKTSKISGKKYGKVKHQLVAYHGRADRALKKLIDRASDFSPKTWEKLIRYAKESRKPSKNNKVSIFSDPFTIPELKFLMLFSPREKLIFDDFTNTAMIEKNDLASLISKIEDISMEKALKILENIPESDQYQIVEGNSKEYCVFSDLNYFEPLLKA